MVESFSNNPENHRGFDQPDQLTAEVVESIILNISSLRPGGYVEFGPGPWPYPIYEGWRKFDSDSPAFYCGIDGGQSSYTDDLLDGGIGVVGRTSKDGPLEALYFKRPATEVYGEIQARLSFENPRAQMIIGDAKRPPLKPGSAQEIFASEMLLSNVMYLGDISQVVKSARESLVPDGLFIIREGSFDQLDTEVLIEELRRAGFGEVFYVPVWVNTPEQFQLRLGLESVFGAANGTLRGAGYFIARGFASNSTLEALNKIPRQTSVQRAGANAAAAVMARYEAEDAELRQERYSRRFGWVLRLKDILLGPPF